jgi:tetratricopeptide (TPR) repeat protein
VATRLEKASSQKSANDLAFYGVVLQARSQMRAACEKKDFQDLVTSFEAMSKEVGSLLQAGFEDDKFLVPHIHACCGCASVYHHLGEFEKAKKLYDFAIVKLEHMALNNPELKFGKVSLKEMFGLASAALGDMWGILGKYEQAIDSYNRAIDILSSCPPNPLFSGPDYVEIVRSQIGICRGLEPRKKILKIAANAFSLEMHDVGKLAISNLSERSWKDAKGIYIKMYEIKKSHPKASSDQSFGEKCFKDESAEFSSTQDEKIQVIFMQLKTISDELKDGAYQVSLAMLKYEFGSNANF